MKPSLKTATLKTTNFHRAYENINYMSINISIVTSISQSNPTRSIFFLKAKEWSEVLNRSLLFNTSLDNNKIDTSDYDLIISDSTLNYTSNCINKCIIYTPIFRDERVIEYVKNNLCCAMIGTVYSSDEYPMIIGKSQCVSNEIKIDFQIPNSEYSYLIPTYKMSFCNFLSVYLECYARLPVHPNS